MNKICFIDNCFKYKEKNTSFHLFPTNRILAEKWSRSINDLNNQNNSCLYHRSSYVCGHHFADCDKHISGKKTLLHKNAVPSIFPRLSGREQHNYEVELINQSIVSPCQDSSDQSEFLMECVDDPLEEGNNLTTEQSSCFDSDCEDFLGFEAADLNNASTVYVVFGESENNASHDNQSVPKEADDDVVIVENAVEVIEIDDNQRNLSDAKETDDELIIVENNIEVIEIDDDDDSEVPPPPPATQTKDGKKFSTYDIQQMVYANDSQIELRKPKLNWKSDQFRFVYINGEEQNLCICTKCLELFSDINIDTIVKHAKCNPTPNVSSTIKRKKVNAQSGENSAIQNLIDTSHTSVQSLTISKIQTIAACMDVQKSTFFQGKRFLHFAQFLIDAGASAAAASSKNKFISEPKYNVLCTFRDQLKDSQVSKICSILNAPDIDFSLSCDVWEDTFRRKTNVSLELHYLDPSFQRHRIVIGMRSVNGMMRSMVDDSTICKEIVEILKVYSKEENGMEFISKATSFVTSGNLDIRSLGAISLPSACSIINDVANGIVNEEKLKMEGKCLQMIALLNIVSTEKITVFDVKKWENVYELLHIFYKKKNSIMQREIKAIFLQVLQPLHHAMEELSDSKNNITKVFGAYKSLETSLMPLVCDKESMKSVKIKAMANLRKAFDASDVYQICMFLDPANRDQYNYLGSNKMDNLQSKIDAMLNPYTTSAQNACVDNDLVHYMDDSVTSQQNQIDQFLQLLVSTKDDALEFWRRNDQMPGLKRLARKYFTIPTYASQSDCVFSNDAKEYLVKRSNLEIKNLETMLMMNSSQFDVDHTSSS